jgi:hypothetical protein
MAYSRVSNRRSSLAARRGTGNGANTASVFVSTGDGSTVFSPSYSIGDVKEVVSNDYTVKYDHEGNSLGEPQKIASFGGLDTSGKEQQSEDAKFLGICNKGNTSVEIMIKVRNYVKQGLAITGVTATAADPTVFTKTSHTLVDDDKVELSNFTEMTEINGMIGTVNQLNANTFEINGVAADSQETTGGTVTRYDVTSALSVKDIVTTATGAYAASPYIQFLLHPKQFMSLPNLNFIICNSNQTGTDAPVSAAKGTEGTVAQTGKSAIDDITDSTGYVETADWFGGTDTEGLVPGSIAIIFYTAGYQEFGITNATNIGPKQNSTSDSGLTANTAYRFKITVDGGTASNISFTTDASDVTWGNGITGNGVLKKINDRFLMGWKGGDYDAKPRIHIVDGDVRVTSGSRSNSSTILFATADGGTGTHIWGAGVIPPVANVDDAVASALETPALLKRQPDDTKHILLDQGNGTGVRVDGGTFELRSATPYTASNNTLVIRNCPPNANFSIFYNYYAALGGASSAPAAAQNMISDIYARCVNKKADKGIVRLFYAN